MPTIAFQTVNQLNLNTPLSVADFKQNFLSGIPLPDSITDETLSFFINASLSELESTLHIKLLKQPIKENKTFYRDDWMQWGFVKATYPIHCITRLKGVLGQVTQVDFAKDWLSIRKTNDNKTYGRVIEIVPNSSATHSQLTIYSGVLPNLYYMNSRNIPNYWQLEYVTGWSNPPAELINALGMLASINVLQLISDALMAGTAKMVVDGNGRQVLASNGTMFSGIGLGMSSKSISLDGLSQSVSSFANGQTGIWGARLSQYAAQMDISKPGTLLNRLHDMYGQVVMAVF